MTADQDFPEKELTYQIIGAYYKVYNALGYGFLESVYQRAMAHELRKRGIRVDLEYVTEVFYDDVVVGHFRSDMIAELKVVIENKACEQLTEVDRRKTLNYLKCTKLEVALLLHFGPKAHFERFVRTQ
jgi:GxxExxY protein